MPSVYSYTPYISRVRPKVRADPATQFHRLSLSTYPPPPPHVVGYYLGTPYLPTDPSQTHAKRYKSESYHVDTLYTSYVFMVNFK